MNSKSLDAFTQNEIVFRDLIDLVNNAPSRQKELMMRLLVVSLAAFWEAFHEDLCREALSRKPKPTKKAVTAIEAFHNPVSRNVRRLYCDVLQIPDIITAAWWGNPADKTGGSPSELSEIVDRMMQLRHDTAHGKWNERISASDCMQFLSTAVHLAVRTDEHVGGVHRE